MASRTYSEILVTGGCGFVGSNLALHIRMKYPDAAVTAFDNFSRNGSRLNKARLEAQGIRVVEGDVRDRAALEAFTPDLILDCAAEPSVLAGRDGTPLYVTDVNLGGTLHCLELARRHGADLVFLSSSRIYPIDPINALAWDEEETRFTIRDTQAVLGASGNGISERFPLAGVRTIYGATKLASELFIEEFSAAFGLRAVINRCGVIAGPWQFGKVDQGFVPLWVARHLFGGELAYIGFGGTGKQTRDVLHVDDLCAAVSLELDSFDTVNGRVYNVGGGRDNTISLQELTALCREITGTTIPISRESQDRPGDIRFYITDTTSFSDMLGWKPRKDMRTVVTDIYQWMRSNEELVRPVFV